MILMEDKMRNIKFVCFVIIVFGLLNSCITIDPNTGQPTNRNEAKLRKKITKAVNKASKELMQNLSNDSIIAVIDSKPTAAIKAMQDIASSLQANAGQRNVSSRNNYNTFVAEDLEYNLVNSGKFRLIDRQRISTIMSEQQFQMSGNVDDDSVSVGKFAGATVVITFTVSDNGSSGRITLKALDVSTASIVAMARADF
jgi:hypothetical protein